MIANKPFAMFFKASPRKMRLRPRQTARRKGEVTVMSITVRGRGT